MGYKSTRRQWVKLWVNEWLDGTTRFELTPTQRLLFIDLLALAGRSRFSGVIYAGEDRGGKLIGYPLRYLAGILDLDETEINNSLLVLKEHSHIEIEEADSRYIIRILGWDKYQSEYSRQREYRQVGNANKRARSYSGGKFTSEEWIALVTLCDNKCLCCGASSTSGDLCPDHVIPLSDNGGGDIFNIQPLCGPCNRQKGASSKDYRPKRLQQELHVKLLSHTRQEGEVEVEGEKKKRKSKSTAPAEMYYSGRLLRIDTRQNQRLCEVYGSGRVNDSYVEADLYLETHPEKHYKNHYAFMRNWLSRAREKAKPVHAEILVGVAPEPSQRRYCASCGHTGSWHLNETKHGRAPDHEFCEKVAV